MKREGKKGKKKLDRIGSRESNFLPLSLFWYVLPFLVYYIGMFIWKYYGKHYEVGECDCSCSHISVNKTKLPVVGISKIKSHFFGKWDVLGDWNGKEFIVYKGEGNHIRREYTVDILYLEGNRYYRSRDCFEERIDETCGPLYFQSANILPRERVFTNKNRIIGFFNELSYKFYPDYPEFHETFFPKTFKLNEKRGRMRFEEYISGVFADGANLCDIADPDCKDPQIWVKKTGSVSGGKGHRMINPKNLVRFTNSLSHKKNVEGASKELWHMQKYIHNPLLLNGRKCSIRQYILIASLEPFILLTFNDARVMCSTQEYDKKNMNYEDSGIHITNNRLQQKLYGKKDGLLNLEMTENILNKANESESLYTMEKETFSEDYHTKMNRINTYIFSMFRNFAFDKLGKETYDLFGPKVDTVSHFYGVYGADTVVDEEGKVWVTEIQYQCSFDLEDPVKEKMLKAYAYEMFSVVNEVRMIRDEFKMEKAILAAENREISEERVKEYRDKVLNLKSVKNFQWVVRGDVEYFPVVKPTQ